MLAAATLGLTSAVSPAAAQNKPAALPQLVPAPVSLRQLPGPAFQLTRQSSIVALGQAASVGQFLAGVLRRSTGYPVPVNRPGTSAIVLALALGGASSLGEEGYDLTSTAGAVIVRAHTTEGLFRGITTLRQLFPPGRWKAPPISRVRGPRRRCTSPTTRGFPGGARCWTCRGTSSRSTP
ncbi:glycoside hydrolase family 20 zincin-like fold domain-containing protein [Fodinicola feengrottensis]|uniref:glycoside hydrolase family 20 zincin-like fold domain-containing protein n=1 Tax=Fodinicola feengrottensis TaxID=435914 RepID=UPI002441874E|nr:glycoside hydrolase family 20 zincin-like fold domain-containing protein [Fodinicola feengrottensis]